MKLQFVTDKATKSTMYESAEAAIAAGMVQKGTSKNYAKTLAQNPGAAVPRQMLWDQPKFEGFCGPSYGKDYETGEECLRYEDWESYEILSR